LPQQGTIAFSDQGAFADYAANSIETLVQSGVLSGFPDGTFRPAHSASREEAASILFRI